MSNQANPQTSGAGAGQTGSGSKSTEPGQYVAPVIAVMNADASGTYGVLQRAKVTITNIDETFSYILSEQQSAHLMNLFRVADTDKAGAPDVLDSSANVDVSLNEAAMEYFRLTIRQALAGAESTGTHKVVGAGSAVDNRNPSEYLTYQAYQDALNSLKYDTLADMIGADDFASFGMSLDMCGGAISLVDKLHAAEAAIRKTLYTQLPETNTEKYLAPSGSTDLSNGVFAAENVSAINFMPFVVGDKVVFVFDVTVGKATAKTDGTRNNALEGPTITRVSADVTPVSNGQAAPSGAGALDQGALAGDQYVNDAAGVAGALVFSAPTRRRIALSLMISRRATELATATPDASTLYKTGEGLIMNFKPATSDNKVKIDPTHVDYRLMLAAGILNGATEIVIDVSSVPVTAGKASMTAAGGPASDPAMPIAISLNDISDGLNWKTVTGCGALEGATSTDAYGRFAFIPDNAARVNEFRISYVDTNKWKLEVNAMRLGVSSGKLYYLENTGTKYEQTITVTTTWA